MAPVLCAIDDRSASKDAARAAIDFCRESGADLTLVGVTRPTLAFTQPAGGEQIRRFQDVEQQVLKAARAAREDGVTAKIVFRAGDPAEELMHEAESAGASDVFLASMRNPSRLAVHTRRGRHGESHRRCRRMRRSPRSTSP